MNIRMAALLLACCCAFSAPTFAQSLGATAEAEQQLRGPVLVKIKGMTCGFCIFGVKKRLKGLPGVESVSVDLKSGMARLILKPEARVTAEQIRQAVKKAGYEAVEVRGETPVAP